MGRREVLERIRKAEDDVKKTVAGAEQEADRDLAAARRKASELVGAAEAESLAEVKAIIDAARSQAAVTRNIQLEKGDAEVAQLRARAEGKLPAAVDELYKLFQKRVTESGPGRPSG